jgi:CubicO group peptidase (beta-lactamase class C family)
LRSLGARYIEKFGFKFLIFAQGRSGRELLDALKTRMDYSQESEIRNAKEALWSIALKRINESPIDDVLGSIANKVIKHKVTGAQIAVTDGRKIQNISVGDAVRGQLPVTRATLFELASLSKTVASAFAMEFFAARGVGLDTPVNYLFAEAKTMFRLKSELDSSWADAVTVAQLMSH